MKSPVLVLVLAFGFAGADASKGAPASLDEIRNDGAFGFPQNAAKVLCDKTALRFSAWSNEEYFFAQAVLWTDDEASLGKTEDNREIGDWSEIQLDLDADGKATAALDRNYSLNPWPGMEGLHYQISMGGGGSTGLNKDSKGRGAIRYLETSEGKRVRVDTFFIPLGELSRKPGDTIRICYWGRSPQPPLTVNSTTNEPAGDSYYGHQIPRASYHAFVLTRGGEIDSLKVPEGRQDISLSRRTKTPMPKVGDVAPEISARAWINLAKPVTLASLRGKVVLVEFWATWCGPCVDGIPHLNELHDKYAGSRFRLLSFVMEGHKTMDKFLARQPVKYPIGLESDSLEDYGISGIPHAFLIDPEGKIVWHGHTAAREMEEVIATALKNAK